MSKVLDKILEPILSLVPDLACYVDPREQALSEETDKLSKGIFEQLISRFILLGVVGGLFLDTPLVKVLSLIIVIIQFVLYMRTNN